MIRVEVLGEPVSQGRPRFSGRGGFVRSYDPPKSREYKKKVAKCAKEQYHGEPLEGQLNVVLKYLLSPLFCMQTFRVFLNNFLY